MVDLHCHIIPWVDDGADNAEIACDMARHALRTGVDTIVATPHCNLPGACLARRDKLYATVFSLFQALLRQRGIPLRVLPGAELYARPADLPRLIAEGRLVTINRSRYLLTEFNFHSPGEQITALLGQIAKGGYVPIVAHPERYAAVQEDPSLAAEWFRRGYLLQLNKGSLLGRLGRPAEQTSAQLLSAGLAHVIASDAHDAYYRPTGFQTLLRFLSRHCPPEYAELLLETNPRRIIADEPVLLPDDEGAY